MTLQRTFLTAAGVLAVCAATPALSAELNIYTTREPGLIQPILDQYTASTGVTVNTVFLENGLAERVLAEGESSPADILMTVDFGNLIDLVNQGVTQPAASDLLDAAVPEALRDPDGNWYALSGRARVLYAAKDLDLTEFTYEQLDDEEWRGQALHPLRPPSLQFRAHRRIHRPSRRGGDRDVAVRREGQPGPRGRRRRPGRRARHRGRICDMAVGNSYYMGLMRSGAGGPEQQEWADAIKVILPTFEGGGTLVNISGAAVAKSCAEQGRKRLSSSSTLSRTRRRSSMPRRTSNTRSPARPRSTRSSQAFGELDPDAMSLTEILCHRSHGERARRQGGLRDLRRLMTGPRGVALPGNAPDTLTNGRGAAAAARAGRGSAGAAAGCWLPSSSRPSPFCRSSPSPSPRRRAGASSGRTS